MSVWCMRPEETSAFSKRMSPRIPCPPSLSVLWEGETRPCLRRLPCKGQSISGKRRAGTVPAAHSVSMSPSVSENLLCVPGAGYHKWSCSKVSHIQDCVARHGMGSPTSTYRYGGREWTPEVLLLQPRTTPPLPWRL